MAEAAFPGERRADDDIYLTEDRRAKPKEVQKMIGGLIAAQARPGGTQILDAGCATGEFLGYLATRFPDFVYTGLDISESMIARARETFPGIAFATGSVLEPETLPDGPFDVILCNGVVQIFDDISPPIRNLLSRLAPNGSLFINTITNERPVDLITRYRYADGSEADWQCGWNVFSTRTFETVVTGIASDVDVEWHSFRMPFSLPERDDPMRAFTIETADNPFQQINGAGLMLDIKTLHARRRLGTD